MIGQMLGHYRIVEQLGAGGMGVVYRARDERLQRSVALKLLPAEMAGQAERRARILAEARAASALNHPGITTIYEVGEDGDQVFIVMELVTGQTLRAMLAQGSMEVRALLRLGTQVAEALGAAHEHGVVHGDVKPENAIVQADGRVKLLDFGIARQMAAETATMTRTAATTDSWQPDSKIAGTLAYMAPEQWRGEAVDGRADLFALGVVLYELASGHRPFPGPTATALMAQILNEAPASLSAVAPSVPAELGRMVHKLLEKQPASRYQSAREVAVDLTNLARDLELGAALPPAVAGKRAVAVLPFKLLTPNAEDEYLSVALADAVINQLSAGGELLVRPVSTVMKYAKQAADPLLAARELNVQVVVEGSIQKFGQKLRVHVQAWKAAEGTSLLSAKQDAEMADLFGLQDRIAGELARALGIKEEAAEAKPEPPTKNPMAYELFLRASERFSRFNRWDTRTAIEMLANAVQLDPRFGDAWARLAEARLRMAVTFEPGPRWTREAEKAVRRALALDPGNAEAQCARGLVLWTPSKGFDHRAALRALDAAIRLNPGTRLAQLWRCLIFNHVGLLDEAQEGLAPVLAMNPDDTTIFDSLAQSSFYKGEYEQAEEYLARALTVDPASFYANVDAPVVALYRQQLDRAAEKLKAALQVARGDPLLGATEALLWAKRGELHKAQQTVKRALQGGRTYLHTHHAFHTAAAVYALIGKPAQVVSLLRKASKIGLPNYPAFRDDPHFQSLHSYPPFLRLMADLKREWEGYRREFGAR